MKVVRTDAELRCPRIDAGLRDRGVTLVILPDGVSESRFAEEAQDADLILMCYTPVTEAVIERASRLRGIVKFGVGIDAIDIRAAMSRGIPVVNVPEYAEETVAEGAFCLMMALFKKLIPIHHQMKDVGWVWPEPQWMASDLAGKTLGILGFGRIGRSMARMGGQGFRMRILVYDPYVDAEEIRRAGAEKVEDLRCFLTELDVLSVHAVLNEQTRGMIGERQLSWMKPTALVINAARGALIDEIALRDALLAGRLGGAGLDVFTLEPLMKDGHPLSALFGLSNVILMPHLTFYTNEAMDRLEGEVLERCDELFRGEKVLIKSGDPRLCSQKVGVRFKP